MKLFISGLAIGMNVVMILVDTLDRKNRWQPYGLLLIGALLLIV